MRSILVDARPGRAGQVRIETGLALARQSGGHLTLLVDTPIDRFVAIDGMGGGVISADALRAAVAEDDAFARAKDAELAREDVCCDVVRTEENPVDALIAGAGLADVVIVSRGDPITADLPLTIGTPVLAVNDDSILSFPLGRVVIAWDGGVEAANALRAAVPLLATAGEVTLLSVVSDTGEFPATDAAAYLSRHGIGAEIKAVARVGSVAATLAAQVEACGADLLVMGAFGHSRVREFLFGGVTRHFLECPAGPALLLAH